MSLSDRRVLPLLLNPSSACYRSSWSVLNTAMMNITQFIQHVSPRVTCQRQTQRWFLMPDGRTIIFGKYLAMISCSDRSSIGVINSSQRENTIYNVSLFRPRSRFLRKAKNAFCIHAFTCIYSGIYMSFIVLATLGSRVSAWLQHRGSSKYTENWEGFHLLSGPVPKHEVRWRIEETPRAPSRAEGGTHGHPSRYHNFL